MKLREQICAASIIAVLVSSIGYFHDRSVQLLRQQQANAVPDSPPSADAIKLCALGFDQLLADFYWLQFVQYIGDTRARKKDRYDAAERYLDLISGLDPHMVETYWFAAFVLGSERHEPQRAAQLIERGIQTNQNNWYLPFIAGINQYLYAHNEPAAARYYLLASKYPDAPPFLARQAEILSAKIPSVIKEINTWDSIYRSEGRTELVKGKARDKLIALWERVYQSAPAPAIKDKARKALSEFAVSAP